MNVREFMTPNPVKVSPNTPISEIYNIFKKERIWSIFVVNSKNLVGIVTKRDLKVRSIGKPFNTPISRIMSTRVHQIDANADIIDAIFIIDNNRINGIAVTENGQLCGILTKYDLRTRYYPRLKENSNSEDEVSKPLERKSWQKNFWLKIITGIVATVTGGLILHFILKLI